MSDKTKKMPRYEFVAQELKSHIVSSAVGTKLPSMRQLMQQFRVSQATMDRGLTILEEEGLAERIPGRGLFVADKKKRKAVKKIDICFFFKHDTLINNPLYHQMSASMLAEAHRHGEDLSIFAYDQMGSVSSFRDRISRNAPDVVVLMCANKTTFELALRHMDIPVVSLFPNAMDEHSISLMIDNFNGIDLSVEHLVGLGHQHIAYLHGQGFQGFYMLDQEERLEKFYEAMRQHNLLVPTDFVRFGGFSPEDGYTAAKELFSAENRPTAIICNDYNADGVYQAAKSMGLSIPHDLAVVGFDDIEQTSRLSPALTTVRIAWQEIAEQVIRVANEISLNDDGRTIRCPVSLVVRDSTQQIQKSLNRKDKKSVSIR